MRINEDGIKELEAGDKISAYGMAFEIKKVLSQQYFDKGDAPDPEYWDVEFLDNNDMYHHYKSNQDRGMIFDKSGEVVSDFTDRPSL